MSAIERAYTLARTGRYASFAALRTQLVEEGCRAVDALLSTRSVRSHLDAICTAASRSPSATETEPVE
jgi:hypothetical protein